MTQDNARIAYRALDRDGDTPPADRRTSTIAWNVDTQYDFMRPDGKLYVRGAERIEPTLENLTRLFENRGIVVVNTADWHLPGSKELSATPNYVTTFPEHCMAGTPGAAYVPATAPKEPLTLDWQEGTWPRGELADAVMRGTHRNIVLYKDAFDVFDQDRGAPLADEVLAALNPQRVIVYGVATNVCVNYAVDGLLKRGREVLVVRDAIKELPNLPLEDVLDSWTAGGAKLITSTEVPSYLGKTL